MANWQDSLRLAKIARASELIQLPLNEQKYLFVSLSACVINVLRVAICFISLQASTGELWSNQFDIARQVDLYFCDGLYIVYNE